MLHDANGPKMCLAMWLAAESRAMVGITSSFWQKKQTSLRNGAVRQSLWHVLMEFFIVILLFSLSLFITFLLALLRATGEEAVRWLARAYGAVMSSLQFLCV